jgi:hypothetical protein
VRSGISVAVVFVVIALSACTVIRAPSTVEVIRAEQLRAPAVERIRAIDLSAPATWTLGGERYLDRCGSLTADTDWVERKVIGYECVATVQAVYLPVTPNLGPIAGERQILVALGVGCPRSGSGACDLA